MYKPLRSTIYRLYITFSLYEEFFFLGWLLQFAANCRKLYDRGGRIWSLAIWVNPAFCNKFAVSASKLQQNA